MNGGAGDDTLVWNNGDNTDVVNGDDGRDDVEVNGAPAAGDVFAVQPNGARIKFDRPNLVPFSLDIGTSETLHANGLGGDDAITVGEVGSLAVTSSGGPGNDTLTGGGSSGTFLGGSGNDTITPGGGIDVVSADEGDDHVNVGTLFSPGPERPRPTGAGPLPPRQLTVSIRKKAHRFRLTRRPRWTKQLRA
jgi:Ca2+-binding RTX toxin-like protein